MDYAVMRHRGELVQMAGTHVQHMHKALTQRDPRIKAKPEIIQKSLVGNWSPPKSRGSVLEVVAKSGGPPKTIRFETSPPSGVKPNLF